MLPVVIVTGPMRSGTSAVAAICHRLGFIAATSMSPPRPPRWHQDYEDSEALMRLLRSSPPFTDWFPDYLRERLVLAKTLISLGESWVNGITLKSPLYAPHLHLMRKAIEAQTGKYPTIIVCDRDPAESDASLEESNAGLSPAHQAIYRLRQAEIRVALGSGCRDMTIHFGRMLMDPGREACKIAVALGLPKPGDLADAVCNVIEPRPA